MASIIPKMMQIARLSRQYYAEKLEPLGLYCNDYLYIMFLVKHKCLSQDELARLICINKSNVTRRLTTLEQNGFVRREISESDKRVTLVYPTEKACKLEPKIREVLTEWRLYLTEGMSEQDLDLLVPLLEHLRDRAREGVDTLL